jgi:hypothetical protein
MENQLQLIVKESGLEKTKAEYILEQFQDYFRIAAEWEQKAKTIVVTNDSQAADMKMARVGRLELREKRIAVENARKKLKEQSLREGKAIDGIANVLKGLIIPIEEYLYRQEHFVEYREMARQEAERLERERKEEEDRIAREKAEAEERERIRLENERLKKEAEEREKRIQIEREKAEAELRRQEEEANRKLAAEHAEREKAEAELRAKKEEAERIAKEEAAKEEEANRATDDVKLVVLARNIDALRIPKVTSKNAQSIISRVRSLLQDAVTLLTGE